MDKWANFLMNEKLEPSKLNESETMQLIRLCEELVKTRGPKIRPHKEKLESRKFLCETAMRLGIDLPNFRHKVTGKFIIGRGLLDAWNKIEQNVIGTRGWKEAKRRDIRKEMKHGRKNNGYTYNFGSCYKWSGDN